MKKALLPVVLLAGLATAACQPMSQQDQTSVGLLGGAAAGFLTASAFGANTEWTVLGTLAGAALGTMVATNAQTGECAYSNGDGTYRTGPCP